MKKTILTFTTVMFCLLMTACGTASGRADEALVGKYIPVKGTALGVTLSGDDMGGLTIELKSGGKAEIEVYGSTGSGKWVNDDTTLTLTVDKTDMVGKLGKDTIIFEGFLKEQVGHSMDVTFAKEGTDAAKPENFLPEEEKALLGDWEGVSVTDVMDDDVSGEISPSALKATLNPDHTAVISFKGEEIATPTWSIFSNTVSFEGDVAGDARIYGEYKDGVFVITYSGEDNYYNFTMENSKKDASTQEKENK